jgi:hypothetical protein
MVFVYSLLQVKDAVMAIADKNHRQVRWFGAAQNL